MWQLTLVCSCIFTILLACQTDKQIGGGEFVISDPRLIDFDTSNTDIQYAVGRVQNYLKMKEKDFGINTFYVDSLYVKGDTIIIKIKQFDYYEVLQELKESERIRKEADAIGDTNVRLWIPPTGNWSGHDRMIQYLVSKDSIIDILYQ